MKMSYFVALVVATSITVVPSLLYCSELIVNVSVCLFVCE